MASATDVGYRHALTSAALVLFAVVAGFAFGSPVQAGPEPSPAGSGPTPPQSAGPPGGVPGAGASEPAARPIQATGPDPGTATSAPGPPTAGYPVPTPPAPVPTIPADPPTIPADPPTAAPVIAPPADPDPATTDSGTGTAGGRGNGAPSQDPTHGDAAGQPVSGRRAVAGPDATPAGTSAPAPTGSAAGWAEVRTGRGPEPGSLPHAGPAAGQAAGPVQDLGSASDGPWSFLSGPQAGQRLFVTGFVALLLSIGGLVTVGIRRHRW